MQDLIPLVKDNVASEDSIKLVAEHMEACKRCKIEFDSYGLQIPIEIDDEKIVSTIMKKLFIVSSALLFIGVLIGMVLKKIHLQTLWQ